MFSAQERVMDMYRAGDDGRRPSRRSVRLREYDYSQPGAYFVTLREHDGLCLFGRVDDGEMRLSSAGEIVREEWERSAEVRPYVTLDAFVVMPNHLHGIIIIADHGGGEMAGAGMASGAGGPVGAGGRGDPAGRPYGPGGMAGLGDGGDGMAGGPMGVGGAGAGAGPGMGAGVGATRRVARTGQGGMAGVGMAVGMARPRGPGAGSIAAIVGQFKSAATKRINHLRNASGAPVWHRNYYEHIIRDEESLYRIREYIINNPAQWEFDREYVGTPRCGRPGGSPVQTP